MQPAASSETSRDQNRERSLANLKPFQKGKSGNPTGRAKKDKVLAEIAASHTELAITTLVNVMKDRKATPGARVSAACEILDRGWGRAPQSLDVKHTLSLSEEFESIIRELNVVRDHERSSERASRKMVIDAEAVRFGGVEG